MVGLKDNEIKCVPGADSNVSRLFNCKAAMSGNFFFLNAGNGGYWLISQITNWNCLFHPRNPRLRLDFYKNFNIITYLHCLLYYK